MSEPENYERLYKAVFDEGTVAHAYFEGPEIRIVRANETMLRYWDKDKSVIGKTFRQALPELNDQSFPDILDKVFQTGESYTGHEMFAELQINGQPHGSYFNFTYKAQRNGEGKVIGIYNVAIEVTEQVLARKSIEESVLRVRNIVENAPFPIGVYTGEEMKIVLANQAIIDVWGKGSDVIGKTYTELLPELKDSPIFQQVKNVFNTGLAFHANNQRVVLNVMGQEKSFYFNYQFTPLYDTAGKIYGVMNTAADVTELNLNQQRIERIVQERTREINEKNNELEKMNSNLQSFAFIASHDLQEPLRKIQTLASRIKLNEGPALSDDSVYLFERMQFSLGRMRDLIRDLLEYSQVGNEPGTFEPTDLSTLIREIKDNVQDELRKTGAELKIGKMCVANVIPFQIRQLMNNLINNSLKFYRKEVPLIIQVNAEIIEGKGAGTAGRSCVLTVEDNGIGFDSSQETKIFEVFHRLHSLQEYQGTGIGLAIVKKIAENHHGRITAKGVPGEGSVFELHIPQ